jgi:hypothetical protein
MATKRNRADSRAHVPCLVCDRKQHGARGLAMHLRNVHDFTADAAKAAAADAQRKALAPAQERPA